MQVEGIREAIVITGHEGERIRRELSCDPSLALSLHFVENARYTAKNGVSLLAARDWIDRDCLLSMADHLYSPELVRRLLSEPLPEGACALAVDRDVPSCFDLDDATKVRTSAGRIVAIGKELEAYDVLDTGVFRIGPALVRELDRVDQQNGDCSLSDGVEALAARDEFFAVDIDDARWIDVDTPAALERAEAMIRVFGDGLGDEPGARACPVPDAEAIETFCPTWVRAAKPYNEDHFAIANDRKDLARLMSNESPYAPGPRVLNAVLEAMTRGNYYPDGARDLKRRLGERAGSDEDGVLLGCGSTELIDVIIRTFVGPGEEVLLSVPTFSMYEARTRIVGGIPILVPMTESHEHDVPELIRSVTERTKVLFICTPNNPTGNDIPEADLRRILRLGLPTIIDEAYLEFGDAASRATLLSEFPNAIVLRTFSKAYGLAGLRLGYLLAHEGVVRLLARVKVPWNVPGVTIAAAMAVLDDVTEFEARMSEMRRGRDELVAGLSGIPGVSAIPSSGNFVLVDISRTGLSADGLVDALLGEGVLIRSLAVHHANRSYVRVTVGTMEQNERCISSFSRVLMRRGRPALELAAGDAE